MRNVFFGFAIIGILIIAGAIFYYLVIFLPQKERDDLQLQQTLEAQRESAAVLAEYRSECLKMNDANSQSLSDGMKQCTTDQCAQNLMTAMKGSIGNAAIEECIQSKISFAKQASSSNPAGN